MLRANMGLTRRVLIFVAQSFGRITLSSGKIRGKGENIMEQTIELDCPPGGTRPGDLIDGVIAGTGLPKRKDVSRLFGEWTWDYSDIPEEMRKRAQPILGERIAKLYNDGIIRYGSW